MNEWRERVLFLKETGIRYLSFAKVKKPRATGTYMNLVFHKNINSKNNHFNDAVAYPNMQNIKLLYLLHIFLKFSCLFINGVNSKFKIYILIQ